MEKMYIKNVIKSGSNCFSANITSHPDLKKGLLRLSDVWYPPSEGFAKLNFVGSKLSDDQSSYGFVIRNSNGEVVLCGDNSIDYSYSIIVVEAWGFIEGSRCALSLGIDKKFIEGDNISVIQFIKKLWKIHWTINALIVNAGENLMEVIEVVKIE